MVEAEGNYSIPRICEVCGSEINYVRAVYSGNQLIVRYVCTECGYSRSLPKQQNLKKRVNTTLANWAKIVKKQSDGKCAVCGSSDYVEAHHILPVRNAPEHAYNIKNGVALCRTCHDKIHSWRVNNG